MALLTRNFDTFYIADRQNFFYRIGVDSGTAYSQIFNACFRERSIWLGLFSFLPFLQHRAGVLASAGPRDSLFTDRFFLFVLPDIFLDNNTSVLGWITMLEAKKEIPECQRRADQHRRSRRAPILSGWLGHDLADRGILLEDCRVSAEVGSVRDKRDFPGGRRQQMTLLEQVRTHRCVHTHKHTLRHNWDAPHQAETLAYIPCWVLGVG